MSATLELTRRLIALPSITPEDAGCQALLGATLSELGFRVETLQFGEVTNLWAVWGERGPLFVFAGHTDVVPPGNTADWRSDPFEPCERDGYLFGRGAADMKGSLAAMLTATSAFLGAHQPHARIGFLITSDEEGSAVDGTRRVMAELQRRGEQIDYCLVGEPSSSQAVGDTIKIGRRGSLSGRMRVKGIQGHVAYPHLADNPIHKALPALAALSTEVWDNGNAAFPATSFQISNINAGTGANNVIPETLTLDFNLRYSTELDAETIKSRVVAILKNFALDYTIDWHLSGEPFLTEDGTLIKAVEHAIAAVTGSAPERSTAGGTSDGRFIAPTGAEVVELGPCNATIHKIDECVRIADLERLAEIYQRLLEQVLLQRL
jgi:succinyl-diaminopimelate desuccinylase